MILGLHGVTSSICYVGRGLVDRRLVWFGWWVAFDETGTLRDRSGVTSYDFEDSHYRSTVSNYASSRRLYIQSVSDNCLYLNYTIHTGNRF